MKTKTSPQAPPGNILAEVWKMKDENAAEHGYDIQAMALAARKRQESHSKRVVRLAIPTRDVNAKRPSRKSRAV
jgi:hypothetical protein